MGLEYFPSGISVLKLHETSERSTCILFPSLCFFQTSSLDKPTVGLFFHLLYYFVLFLSVQVRISRLEALYGKLASANSISGRVSMTAHFIFYHVSCLVCIRLCFIIGLVAEWCCIYYSEVRVWAASTAVFLGKVVNLWCCCADSTISLWVGNWVLNRYWKGRAQ